MNGKDKKKRRKDLKTETKNFGDEPRIYIEMYPDQTISFIDEIRHSLYCTHHIHHSVLITHTLHTLTHTIIMLYVKTRLNKFSRLIHV